MMLRYEREGRIVEAVQWFKHGDSPAVQHQNPVTGIPQWGWIGTPLDGEVVQPGDYIITDEAGNISVRSSNVFDAHYRLEHHQKVLEILAHLKTFEDLNLEAEALPLAIDALTGIAMSSAEGRISVMKALDGLDFDEERGIIGRSRPSFIHPKIQMTKAIAKKIIAENWDYDVMEFYGGECRIVMGRKR